MSLSDRNRDRGIAALHEARDLLHDRDMRAVVVVGLLLGLPACWETEEPRVPGSISVFLGNGDGTLLPRSDYSAEAPRSLVVADFDGDGLDDIAAVGFGPVNLLRGNGDGTFEATSVEAGERAAAVAAADINGDTAVDLVTVHIGNGVDVDSRVSVMANDGAGAFSNATTRAAPGANYTAIAIADFNLDSFPDVAIPNYGNKVSVLSGGADATVAAPVDSLTGRGPYGLVAADLDRDGKPDLVSANWNFGLFSEEGTTISVLRGRGDGTFDSPLDIEVASGANHVVVADVDRDSIPDLLVTCNPGRVFVLLGRGDGTFFEPRKELSVSGWNIAVGDLDSDGILDLAGVANNQLAIARGLDDGTFDLPQRYETNRMPLAVAITDFNRDGALDVVVANQEGSTAY